jgi:hypothetical protein
MRTRLTTPLSDVHRGLAGSRRWPTPATSNRPSPRRPARPGAPGPDPCRGRGAADRTIDLIRDDGYFRAEIAAPGMRLPPGMLLVVRAFELWIHQNDIRGQPPCPARYPTHRRCA